MLDPSDLLQYWGYPAIFFFVFLGNLGFPVPEETVLLLAGFLVWKGDLKFLFASAVGVVSAIAGDNFGYWTGRRFGTAAALRYGKWVFVTPERVGQMQDFMSRYGAPGIFLARFFPGIRFLAGPLAGTVSMAFQKFFVANALGAVIYVPLMLALGYGVGMGLSDYIQRFEQRWGRLEYIGWLILTVTAVVVLAWRIMKRKGYSASRHH